MKVDYEKFPQIPPGCQLNPKANRPGEYQVFREIRCRNADGTSGVERESIGVLRGDTFTFSKIWLERQELRDLREENRKLREALGENRLPEIEKMQNLSGQIHSRVQAVAEEAELETRNASRIVCPLEPIVVGALVSALSGASSTRDIAQTIRNNKSGFSTYFKDFPDCDISDDTVYRAFMRVDAQRFDAFVRRILEPMVRKSPYRIISGDGQAIRATALAGTEEERAADRAYMLMNFYDSTNRVCLAQQLIEKKTNEITVGPKMLETLDIRDAIITADAMSCQVGFVTAVIAGGADYCLSLKGNQDRSWSEVSHLFATTHEDQIETYTAETELAHGRIECRSVSVIRGALLSKTITAKWPLLAEGSIVRVRRFTENKRSGKKTGEDSFYITSILPLAGAAEKMHSIIRSHWAVENNLHWVLDVNYNQDRMQAIDKHYITNRSALNKLTLAMLEHYRFWLWDKKLVDTLPSIRQMQMRCRNFDEALQCIACSQGLLFV